MMFLFIRRIRKIFNHAMYIAVIMRRMVRVHLFTHILAMVVVPCRSLQVWDCLSPKEPLRADNYDGKVIVIIGLNNIYCIN